MINKCAIVMYHYVRNIKNSLYPDIKGLEVTEFREQLKYFSKNYSIIQIEDLIESIEFGKKMPENSILLTFDDGYIDHYENVLPILKTMGIKGCFYPPVKTTFHEEVLDVNKIHFILANAKDKKLLVKELFNSIDENRSEFKLLENEMYYKNVAFANRFDDKDTVFMKRMLQRELPEVLRKTICKELFESYVDMEETEFSKILYMNIEQLKDMKDQGMHIGSHGYNHIWLNTLDKESQLCEIERSLNFLKTINNHDFYWSMCYPYGAYNEDTKKILSEKKCKLAFTTKVDFFVDNSNRFEIPRFDTNDFYPKKNIII